MNPFEIHEALADIARKPLQAMEFPLYFVLATGTARTAFAKLKGGACSKPDIPGGVLLSRKRYFAPALPGMSVASLDALRTSKRNAKHNSEYSLLRP